MPELSGGLLGCYLCGNAWVPRKAPVSICPRCKSKLWNVPRPPRARSDRRIKGQGIADVVGRNRRAVLALGKTYGARNVRVFGSVARGEAEPNSDLDILVTFDESPGLLGREEFRERLEELLVVKVDLATERTLHWYIRPNVLREAVPL